MAVKTNKSDTAGPPLAAAFPMVLKIPAPMMAATPRAVKSTTRSVFFMPPECKDSESASVKIFAIDFLRIKLEKFTGQNISGENNQK